MPEQLYQALQRQSRGLPAQLPALGRAGCQPSAAPRALLAAERAQTHLGLLVTSALKKQEENAGPGKDHLPDGGVLTAVLWQI